MGSYFPLNFKREASTGPTAPGIGLVPAHVHGGLGAVHASGCTKAGLHDCTAGNADLVYIARSASAFADGGTLQPLPAFGAPELLSVIAVIVYKFDVLRPR